MHQNLHLHPSKIVVSPSVPPKFSPPATTSSIIKIVIIFTIIVVILLYVITNLFFSLELRLHHKTAIEDMQHRLRHEGGIHHHHFAESLYYTKDKNTGKEVLRRGIEEIHGEYYSQQHQESRNQNSNSVTTRTPSSKDSGEIFERKIAAPFPKFIFEQDGEVMKNYQKEEKKHHHDYLKLGFRDIEVNDVSLKLVDARNVRHLAEHYVRAAKVFFPEAVAKKWRKELYKSWRMSEKVRGVQSEFNYGGENDEVENNSTILQDHWLFTTNNNGKYFGRKEASHKNIAARKKLALDQYLRNPNAFGYTKWELQRQHPLHLEIKKFMQSKETKISLCHLMAEDCAPGFVEQATVGDFFISLFESDDFLSPHSDMGLGSITTASHFLIDRTRIGEDGDLLDDVDPETESGAVEFHCADKQRWCIRMRVSKNELVAFKTQPDNALHRVTQMVDGKKYLRFGITGFYAMPGESQVLDY